VSYRNLEVWKLARELSIEVHRMTLSELPKFEMFEEGCQIRRSAKSIRSNIVEGYGRRRYPAEYIKHLTYAIGSCDETTDHLETLSETGSLKNTRLFQTMSERLQTLGKKLNLFIQSIERAHLQSAPPARARARVAKPAADQ
jgi:four helix bundle protein